MKLSEVIELGADVEFELDDIVPGVDNNTSI